jgi:dihydroflavonol-4-reductase
MHEAGRVVFITGATGFVGGAVARKLVEAGCRLRALVRPGADLRQLAGLPVEQVSGDLSNVDILRRGMAGCDWVFHVAALYSYWGHTWDDFYRSNVQGTRNVMEAAGQAGVGRVVYTSSIAVLGQNPDHSPANEDTPVTLDDMIGSYKRSKFMAEEAVHDFARQGLRVVIVNPSAPVGVGDYKPTRTGQMILDYLEGRMLGYVKTGLNIVDVEDVASGHLLAAQIGRVGERYILGGDNLTLKQVLDCLAEVSGRSPVRLRIPRAVAMAWGYFDVGLARLNKRHKPTATPETVRLSRRYEFYDSGKAARELGYTSQPASQALGKAVAWYRANGYVK